MDAMTKKLTTLVGRLAVSEVVAGRMIAAGLHTVKVARRASVEQLTAITGIDASKAAAIRAGGQ